MIAAWLVALVAATQDLPKEPPGFWQRDTLLGDLGGVRPTLAEHGISSILAFTGEIISNTSGGAHQDTGADLLLDWVLDADLEKALGWTGGSARLNPMWLAGDGVAGDVGDLTLVSNITGRGGVRIFEAWLQQSLVDDVLSLRAGILAADQEFILSGPGMLYFNSVFGGPVFLSPNLRWPIYPVGALGARLRANVAKGVYVQAAAYNGDPGSEDENRTGLRTRLSGAGGVFSIAEAGWSTGETRRSSLKVGGFHHSGEFVEFSSGAVRRGLSGGYVAGEQTLVRDLSPIGGCRDGGVAIFLRSGIAQDDRAFVFFGLDAGVNLTGLLPGRPADILGLGVIYARISRDFAASQPDRPRWGHETVFEATYKIALAPWWSLQPDVQYVVHPGGSTATPNAVVLGVRIDLLF
ncbi:MAG TPA: carbohydrate porin [Planctomycetota bacterium]|jgi:porin|nr:carbohydrate porin [Planctomycetota bacterium]